MRASLLISAILSAVALHAESIHDVGVSEQKRLDRELAPLMTLHDAAAGNLARGKSYTFSERPNYGGCSGPSDMTDLTNGKSESSASGIWVCQDCVCWSSKELVEVTIDLGSSKAFDCVRVYSGGGRAGVLLPSVILVEASDDNKDYRLLGDLATLSKVALPRPNSGFHVFVFEGKVPAVKSRYVRLRMRPVGQYLPITEIEVMAASPEARLASLSDLPASPNKAELMLRGKRAAFSTQIRENMLRLAEEVRYDGAGFDALVNAISHYHFEGMPDNFKAIYPFCYEQKQLFGRHAAQLRKQGAKPLIAMPCDFYEKLSPVSLPAVEPAGAMTQIMMNGEIRGCGLVLCNTTERPMTIRARLEGLEGTIYETGYIDSEFFYVTSTLLQAHKELTAVPGMVCHLAVRLTPNGLSAGMHSGKLILDIDGKEQSVPVELEILPGKLPKTPKLLCYGWDYLDTLDGGTMSWLGMPLARFSEFRKMRCEDLCLGTAGCGASELIACPHAIAVDKDGNILSTFDFKAFDRWLERNAGAQVFAPVSIGLNWGNATFGNLKLQPGTPAFNRALTQWGQAWNKHILEKGLKGRIFMQFFDEPGLDKSMDTKGLFKLMQQWHTPFHKGAPDIPLFIDPCDSYLVENGKYLTNGEIFCPEAELLHGEGAEERLAAIRKLREEGHPIHVYSCSFGPFMGEPGAFRNQAWMTFRIGGVGMGFWGGTELTQSDSFNRYAHTKNYFCPYLLDETGLHLTKHACAQRDGVQDFEYLVLCDQLLQKAEKANKHGVKALRQSFNKEILAVAGRREQFSGAGTNMAARAENARRKIIGIIKQLSK